MRVTWIHPSWRDLVVDTLAASPAERQAFLRAAELHGIELALSVGGGPTGERAVPLLVADEDWDALGDAVHRLARESGDDDARRLLAALAAALASTHDARARGELHAVSHLALTTLRRHVTSWEPELLERWVALAGRLPEPPAAPDVDRTLALLRPGKIEADDGAEVARLDTWLAVVELVQAPLLMRDRALLAHFIEQLRLGEEALTADQESALGRIARLDAALAAPAHWVLDNRGVVLDIEPERPIVPEPPRAEGRRVRRILLDL